MPAFIPTYTHISSSRASSLRNPCPDGTGIGYATFDNSTTIFVICDAAFAAAGGSSDSLALGLGLGLGLGIPAFVAFMYITLYFCGVIEWSPNHFCRCRWTMSKYASNEKVTPLINISPREWTEKHLSADALDSFRFGNLTQALKDEIMVLRVREGRNLTELVKFAEQINVPEIANYVANLNSAEIPVALRQKALMPIPISDIPRHPPGPLEFESHESV